MEFEFGTNWRASRGSQAASSASLSPWKASLSFFLESAFWASSYTAKNASPKECIGSRPSWFCSAPGSPVFFIIVTDAWMQHPVAYDRLPNGQFEVLSFLATPPQPLGAPPIRA